MRKVIILLALTLSLNTVFAQNATLDKIENSLFGFDYGAQTNTERLNRIEEAVYGKINTGNESQRIAKLKNDMAADLIGQEIPPVEDTFMEEEESNEIITRGANINYPAVNELEQELFNQEFKDKDLKERLAALEEKAFGKTYSDDFSTRVDRLKAEIKPKSLRNNAIVQSANEFYDDEESRLDENYSLSKYDPPSEFSYEDYNSGRFKPARRMNLTAMENTILRRAFQNDTTENRLARLENRMFGTMFENDDEKMRIDRLSSAVRAQKSSPRYDSNKFSQNMATAMQIGTILLMMLACIL